MADKLFFFFQFILFVCTCVCLPEDVCAKVHRGQKRALNPLELELWVLWSQHVGIKLAPQEQQSVLLINYELSLPSLFYI